MVKQFYNGYGEHFKKCDDDDVRKAGCIADKDICPAPCSEEKECCERDSDGIFGDFGLDDLILIGVLIFLINDGVDDYILLLIIGVIFLVGFIDNKDIF